MKKLNSKTLISCGFAAIMAISAFISSIANDKQEKKIDELIEKVSDLTEKE